MALQQILLEHPSGQPDEAPAVTNPTRRLFLKQSLGYLRGIAALLLVTSTLPDKAPPLSITPETKQPPIQTIPLLEANKGLNRWLTNFVLTDPASRQAATHFLAFLQKKAEVGERLKYGDSLKKAYDLVNEALGTTNNENLSPYNLSEVWRKTFAVHATGYNTLSEPQDIEKLGVKLNGTKGVQGFYWDIQNGLAIRTLPLLFGFELNDPTIKYTNQLEYWIHYAGPDRGIHAAQHSLLASEILYLSDKNLLETAMLPNILNVYLNSIADPAKRARSLSLIAGRTHEWSTLIRPLLNTELWDCLTTSNPLTIGDCSGKIDLKDFPLPGNKPNEGPFEIGGMVLADYKANTFGAEIAIEVRRRIIDGKPFESLFEQLNDPRYRYFKTPPILNLPPIN